jgi:integrase
VSTTRKQIEPGIYRMLKTGRYVGIWRDPAGQQRSRTFQRLEDARRYRRKMLEERDRGVYTDPTAGKRTVAEFWPEFLAGGSNLSASTRNLYEGQWRLRISPTFGRQPLRALTRRSVQAWVNDLSAAGVGTPTIEVAFRTLSVLLSAAEAAEIIGRNPAQGVKVPRAGKREMRFLVPSELLTVADTVHPRYRALVLLLGLCGPRIGEAAALTVEDVDLLRRKVTITKAAAEVAGKVTVGRTKTRKSRSVMLPRTVVEALEAHLSSFPPGPGGLLFTSEEGGIIHRTNFRRRVWMPAVREAGIASPLPRVHDLRHTAASLAIASGGHPKAVAEMLGHEKVQITLDRYGHLFPGLQDALAEAIDARFLESQDAQQLRDVT